jgi:glycosyltransferase involved in cell wall biosynthesis
MTGNTSAKTPETASTEVISPVETTIILSTFNGGAFLVQQLDSLYAQTRPSIGILVRDDGSSDGTLAILNRARADARIEILASHANLGAAHSFFELLKAAAATTTKYVAFCDQDDVWRPDKMARAVKLLAAVRDGAAAMYCSRLEIVDQDLAPLGFTTFASKVGLGNALVENVCVGCTIVLNRKAVELLCEDLPTELLTHDWWCYLFLSCFGEIIFDDDAPIKYRQHSGNVFGAARGRLDKLQRNLRRFFGRGDRDQWQSAQALVFLTMLGDRIPASQRQVLRDFIEAKSSWRLRLRLVLSNNIWRQKKFDNLIWRVLILMNRY